MAIYTKKGDKGQTSLFNQTRVAKDSLKIEAIGAVDEVTSYLGIISSESKELKKVLSSIQKDLFTLGAILAGAHLSFSKTKIKKLEKIIDELEEELPVLKNFVLPQGTPSSAELFFARALARRAERRVVALAKKERRAGRIIPYLNRLSAALFMLAREVNFKAQVKEELWKGSSK
ncbi:MAG: cob(I)yrinic acid a,c-diamide adenosyltransferase [Patescibacteria group bacterium]